jgi:hypothetical protein
MRQRWRQQRQEHDIWTSEASGQSEASVQSEASFFEASSAASLVEVSHVGF